MAERTIPILAEQQCSEERELLSMILDSAHIHDRTIHGKSVMTVLLTDKQIDLLRCYGLEVEDRDDDHDAVHGKIASR